MNWPTDLGNTSSWYSALCDGIADEKFKDDTWPIFGIVKKDGELYEIIEDKDFSDDGDFISHITDNGDGTYTYLMSFYNGGTCLSEMLEDAL